MTLLFAADSEVPSGGLPRLVAAGAAEKTDGGWSPRE
jgi:hypothetical protein